MNKNYLPFYDSLKDDDKEFWLNCSKEELIDHIVSNIRNGETLLSRIDKAIEYITSRSIKAGVELMPREKELLKILKGE